MTNRKHENLTGRHFSELTVISCSHKVGRKRYWLCECSCGQTKTVRCDSLKDGSIRSCGHLKREQDRANLDRVGKPRSRGRLRHGEAKGSGTREYRCWSHLRQRCLNPNDNVYPYYGARGIGVCERWLESYENFLADMGRCPPGCSIDRVNNDGPYAPENCRWATRAEQNSNRRRATHVD